MKYFQFILCFLPILSTIHGITVYENSNVSKRSPTPYRSYIEFEDKREGGGYGYKFQVEGDHTEQQTHWQQPKHEETNAEEDNSYFPNNYEQVQSYTHHAPIPIVKQPNIYIKQEQQFDNGLQPQITFESNLGSVKHAEENKVAFNNHLRESEENLQSYPNLFLANNEHINPSLNPTPIKLSQVPIITKYVPVPVKYMPNFTKKPVVPSRGNIKFASFPTKNEPVIIMNPNIGLSSQATNAPVKYIMVPVQPSLDTKPKNMYDEHIPKQIQYKPNPNHQEHIVHQQNQIFEHYNPKDIQHQQIYEEEMPNEHQQQIKPNIPVKYIIKPVKHSNKETQEIKYIPQKQIAKPLQGNNQYFNEDLQKTNEQNYQEYLPNRLAHPVVNKQVVQYHIKTNIPDKDVPPMEGQPMYEYKTIQEEDYRNPQPSVEYEMLNMPEFINKLPIKTIDLQNKFIPQNIALPPQQNFIFPNNIRQGMELVPGNNFQTNFGVNQQFKQVSSGFGHDLMPNVNFNLDFKRRSNKEKDGLKSNQRKVKYSKEQVKHK